MKSIIIAALGCALTFAVTSCVSPTDDDTDAGTAVTETSTDATPEPNVELPADPPSYGVQVTDIDELRAYVEAAGIECDSYSERDVTIEGIIDFRNCSEEVVLATFEDHSFASDWYRDRISDNSSTLLGDQFADAPYVAWCVGGPGEATNMLAGKLGGVSSAFAAEGIQ